MAPTPEGFKRWHPCRLNVIILQQGGISNMLLLTATDQSCGRAQEAAPPLCPSGSSDTRPAHTQVVSDWTAVRPSTLPGGGREREENMSQLVCIKTTFVKTEWAGSHHDFHGTPAWRSPVHGHPLVYYKRHGPNDLCDSHVTPWQCLSTLQLLRRPYLQYTLSSSSPSIGLLTSFLLAKTMST